MNPVAVPGGAPALLHPTVDGGGHSVATSGGSVAALYLPEDAPITDQQRLGVVLQAAALLGHCEQAGLRLVSDDPGMSDPWAEARVDGDGSLRGLHLCPGRDVRLPQTLLLALLRRLFRTSGDSVSGRGAARRAARELIELWGQELEPQSPDQAVGQLLDSAAFLWGDGFVEMRQCLAAGIATPDRTQLFPWLVAPGRVRRRFLRRAETYDDLLHRLGSDEARDIWDGLDASSDPREFVKRGAYGRAAASWSRKSKLGTAERLEYSRCLIHLGRFADAAEVTRAALRRNENLDAVLCLARAQLSIGERRAADKTLRGVRKRCSFRAGLVELGPEAVLDWAEIEVRLAAARGPQSEIRSWADRLIRLATEASATIEADRRNLAWILAAGAAYDLGDPDTMRECLEPAAGAVESEAVAGHPEIAARWLHMEGLRRLQVGDGPGACEHVAKALVTHRRAMPPSRAGRLWNDLAVARALADDLPGAERACRHALRLLSRTQGPARLTLALYNLAEVRLRRGRWKGVAATLERSSAENRRTGNQRGLLLDLELWARVELAQGRAAAALARCAEAHDLLKAGAPGRPDVFHVLASRAYGWLGRRRDAEQALASTQGGTLLELEPEERPAILALAGRLEEAVAESHSTPWEPLWSSLAAGEHPSLESWRALDLLEPYRAARLVLDVEILLPGATPSLPLRRAVHTFRSLGVEAFAELLEQRSTSPWLALREYLDEPRQDLEPAARLLRSSGYSEARLEWRLGGDGDEPEILVAGQGGEQQLVGAAGKGDLMLSAPQVDGVLEALFALLREDLERLLEFRSPFVDDIADDGGIRDPGLRDGLVGRSAALRRALDRLDRLAGGDLPILILGESGTGKELVARRIHRKSRRHSGPILPINCAALSETLIQSDLFGHVRGAFTGADKDRAGVFEAARGGTVFLDEIGDLPLSSQGKLLRVLQEGEIRRVGESFARKVDVRVVAATHRDLAKMVDDGEFREDLFYRLRVAKVELPPLRERGEDLIRVAEFLLRRIPAGPRRLTPAAAARLKRYSWPGNVREMRNILEVASALADGDEVTPEVLDLPAEPDDTESSESATNPSECAIDYHFQVESLRRRLVSEALEWSHGNRAEAARRLGMSRQALSYLVKQLGLS
ncbi:MAG: sigma 54-interacting transcriptional regulator [Thermoanaerobaculia bacterium]|nr:sigma 54-interacting transcriptional regulator [Thermoanaerobaculia bacterium]